MLVKCEQMFAGNVQVTTEGIILSGTKTVNGSCSGDAQWGAEGAMRMQNLSGKRTEASDIVFSMFFMN